MRENSNGNGRNCVAFLKHLRNKVFLEKFRARRCLVFVILTLSQFSLCASKVSEHLHGYGKYDGGIFLR